MNRCVRFAGRVLSICALPVFLVCCQTKTLQVTSDPDGADIFLTRIQAGRAEETRSVGRAPVTVSLAFGKDVTYRVEAKKRQYRPAEVIVEWEPQDQKTLPLRLEQYLQTVPVTQCELLMAPDQTPRLIPVRREMEGYLDTSESGPLVASCNVLQTEGSYADLTWVSASKTDPRRVVFQVVTEFMDAVYDTPRSGERLRDLADRHDLNLADLRQMNNLPSNQTEAAQNVRYKIAEPKVKTRLFRREADGTGATVVTNGQSTDLYPSFTWSGTEIIFTSDSISKMVSKGLSIYTLHSVHYLEPDRRTSQIIASNLQNYAPVISMKNVIYFTSLTYGNALPQIWSVQRNGGELSQLADNGEFPQVSYERGEVLFLRRVSERNANRQIWRMAANGANQIPLTSNETYDISGAAWSPDGEWIVFASNEKPNADGIANYSLWIINRDGRNLQRLTSNGSWDDSPTWNSTGEEIFFRSNRGGKWRIWNLKLNKHLLPS